MSYYYLEMKTDMGALYLTASAVGLRSITWEKPKDALPVKSAPSGDNARAVLRLSEKELSLFFKGRLKKFSMPMDLQGTEFQKQVWKSLLRIPYGKTWSYRDLAASIKKPKAFRAVGNANGKNPLCIVIPCHRVIAADGSLGGYTGGLKIKKFLLNIEGVTL